jgi:hypothetical protein
MISEFMAINNTSLPDEDGAYSDWIELYNSGTNTVNLAGWYLSNKSTNLTQWQFPSTNLGPSAFMVVFASNKDRRVPGSPLHTNFKLSGSGEYLALVTPDGLTKATEFSPAFPPQYPDISYGYMMTGAVSSLIMPTSPARAWVPTTDSGTSWHQTGFDDSSWAQGNLGVGYDTSGNYNSAIGLNLQSSMLNLNASAYLRILFSVPDPSTFKLLNLGLRYDDGFVAYLNGAEVLRRNAPMSVTWNSAATAPHGTPTAGTLMENFENSGSNYSLSQYGMSPTPAVQATNNGSTGRFLRLLYDGVNNSANTLAFNRTVPGLFQTIATDFDFRLTSGIQNPADGFAFMLIPTALYGTNGPGVNITSQSVEQPNYAGVFGVGFRVYPHPSVNNVSAHWNGARQADAAIPLSRIDLASGVFHHAKITVQFGSGGAFVTVTLNPNINGLPGAPYSPISNLFIPGMNSFDGRVQFGARTGGLNMACDLDNCSVQFLPPQGPIAFEDFDLTPFLSSLLPGQNLLALQGLNLSVTNANFLVQPQLSARQLKVLQPATYLYPSTPGAWNSSAGSAFVPEPVTFWPPSGIYASNVLPVTLAGSSSSETIHYTLDGSNPGINSRVYTNTIVLTTNATIRARAESSGILGETSAANYVLLASSVTNFSSNLPLVVIDTLGQTIPDGWKVGAYGVFIGTNGTTGRASLLGQPNYLGRVGIGLHGSSSLGFPKLPYAIELDNEGGGAVNYPLLGFPPGNDWLLYPSYDDKTFMNNVLTEEIFRAMGHYGVRCQYAELFLRTTPGKFSPLDYQGIYILIERIRVESNRVDIANLKGTDVATPAVTGGYIISKDKINDTNDVLFTTTSGQQLIVNRPSPDSIIPEQYEYISSYVNQLEGALYGANWRDPLNGYAAYIDADSCADYHWIVEYSKNIDGIRISNYMTKDREGKLKMEPLWDWDLSWGNANYFEGGKINGWYYPLLSDYDDIWLRRLRTDPDFYQKIIDRWGALRLSVFNAPNLLARVDQLTNYLCEAQKRDFVAWPRLGTYVWPNPNGAAGGWDVDYVTPTTYPGIISEFKKFILGRYLWIDQQFVPAPTLVSNGANFSFFAPLGSIYYTLDGTDPRASGGGISRSSGLYNGSLSLTSNAVLFARAFYTNSWSAPVKALYVDFLPALRITEINYHPAPPPVNSPYTDKDFEFVEIQNIGTNVINLSGAHLGGGIEFTFGPNQLTPIGSSTSNNFDGGGTPFAVSTLTQPPGAYLTNDGPAGTLLRLLNSTTNIARNRVTFDQTATGACDRLTVDFDFRAATISSSGPSGARTMQDFDSSGTAYALTNRGVTAPVVLPADAGSVGSFLRLVPASGQQLGVVALAASAAGAFSSVVATFDFRITPPVGATPADGLGFALLNTTIYGSAGIGPYFSEEPNLSGSLGVGFDVYNNASTSQEPNNNHVSLHWNGAQIGNAFIPSFSLSNGKFNRAQVIVWFSGNNAYVTVRLTPDINGTPGPTETVLDNLLVSGAAPYECRAAFGARTGGAWAAHDLDNVNVQFSQRDASAAGLSLLFLPVAQFGATGPGTTLSTFSDWPLVPSTFAMDLGFNPSNTFNDVSVYWNRILSANALVTPSVLDLDSGAFHHAHLQLDSTNGGVSTTLALTPNSLGVHAPPVPLFTNLFLAGARLDNRRLEFAGRNGGLSSRVDLENVFATYEAWKPPLLDPGGLIVVVHNLSAFRSRYDAGIPVAGEFSGSLGNSGDHLTLSGPLGEPILDFNYDPAWYPSTDVGGFSMVAIDPFAPVWNWGLASNWRPSAQPGGSPGRVDVLAQNNTLTIVPDWAQQQITLSWPAGAVTYDLYSTTSLSPPNPWNVLTNTPAVIGDRWVISLPLTNRECFYRLKQR